MKWLFLSTQCEAIFCFTEKGQLSRPGINGMTERRRRRRSFAAPMRDDWSSRCTTLNMHFTKSAFGRKSHEERRSEGKGEKWRLNKCGDLLGGEGGGGSAAGRCSLKEVGEVEEWGWKIRSQRGEVHCVIERKHVRLHVRPEPLIFSGSRLDETRTAANSGQCGEETSGRLSLNSFTARERKRKKKSLSPLQRSGGTNRGRSSAAAFVLDQQIHFANTRSEKKQEKRKKIVLWNDNIFLSTRQPHTPMKTVQVQLPWMGPMKSVGQQAASRWMTSADCLTSSIRAAAVLIPPSLPPQSLFLWVSPGQRHWF